MKYTGNIERLINSPFSKKKKPKIVLGIRLRDAIVRAKRKYGKNSDKVSVDEIMARYRLDDKKAKFLINEVKKYRKQLIEEQGRRSNTADTYKVPTSLVSVEPLVSAVDNILEFNVHEKLKEIRSLREHEEKLHGNQSKIEQGFVYAVTNEAWPEWVKVGMTLDFVERLGQYNVYDPNASFTMNVVKWVPDRKLAETKVISVLTSLGFRKNGEWFNTDLRVVQNVINDI